MYVLAISKDKVLLLMIILIMPGIVLCVGLLVVLPSPAEARATGGWLRFLKMLEEMKEDYPFPAEVEEQEQEEESESSELTPVFLSPASLGWIEDEMSIPLTDDLEDENVGCHVHWSGLSQKAKDNIVDWHNAHRLYVAKGHQKGLPHAANMRLMTWDTTLENWAQNWASKCAINHNPDSKRKGYGENLYWACNPSPADRNSVLNTIGETSVKKWYSEVSYFDRSYINPFQYQNAYGHFSQVVWADTDKIGCGIAHFKISRCPGYPYTTALVCNYKGISKGNLPGAPMYVKGTPCSQCGGLPYCYHKGLCGN